MKEFDIKKTDLLNFTMDLALETGELLKKYARKKNSFSHFLKKGHGVQCDADLASEDFIIGKIKKNYPKHLILSEEKNSQDYQNKSLQKTFLESPFTWIIDPLDGTTNYLRGLDYYSISIALLKEGKLYLGVVYRPCMEEIYYALEGKGAYYSQGENDLERIKGERLDLESKGFNEIDLQESIWSGGGKISPISSRIRTRRILGCASYEICCVSRGGFDGFYKLGPSPWDFAASALICHEAGAYVSNRFPEKSIEKDPFSSFDLFIPSILAVNRTFLEKIVGHH